MPAANAYDSFKEILDMAQRVKADTIADAKAKAAKIVENAENEVRARLGDLMNEKDAIEKEIEALKAAAKEYKNKFNDVLAAAQEALDAAEGL